MDGVVGVAGGAVRGRDSDGIVVFAGIPFARAPEGPLRWRAPEPPEPWSGVRPCAEFGPIAPQVPAAPGVAIPGDPSEQSEDCLSLNVWTSSLRDRRPVLVWVHGGGFTGGSGSSLLYRGHRLVRSGDAVVVTINYRLGALGFLAHPALADSASAPAANFGLLDQVAALRWVRRHIADFGGNPDNVTVFGESAGGMSVAALLAAPVAAGLFHRAVIQSGPPFTHSSERARLVAEELAALVGVRAFTRAAMERVPARELVAATRTLQGRPPPPGELPLPFLPVVDGSFLPVPPLEAVVSGTAADVPLLIGTNRDELAFFAVGDPRLADIDHAGLVRWVERAAPGVSAAAAIETYRRARSARGEPTSARDLWVAIGTDLVFRRPSLQLATAHAARAGPETYVYLFTRETPAFGGLLGSCHALEIPYVFGTLTDPAIAVFAGTGDDGEVLSAAMRQAWTSFALSGDPSGERVGAWPAWEPDRRSTMVFGPQAGVRDAPREGELAAWDDEEVPAAVGVPGRGAG